MFVRLNVSFIVFAGILMLFQSTTLAAYLSGDVVVDFPFVSSDLTINPKTKNQVLRAYQSIVEVRDGVNENEAKIIAQFELMNRHQDSSYDLSKPKVLDSTADIWKIQFPPFFSLHQFDKDKILLVCVDRATGYIECFTDNFLDQK